jgi:3-dehydroquinate dehydratase
MTRILLLNGPNLNLLGTRQPEIYGAATLTDIEAKLKRMAAAQGHELIAAQSNAEHELIAKVQATKSDGVAFVIINPGAFTHTSIALRDAFLAVSVQRVRTRRVQASLFFVRSRRRLHRGTRPPRVRTRIDRRLRAFGRSLGPTPDIYSKGFSDGHSKS